MYLTWHLTQLVSFALTGVEDVRSMIINVFYEKIANAFVWISLIVLYREGIGSNEEC